MRVLICADAHGSLAGLDAVLRAAPDVDRKVFLGDAVSYGPHPRECLHCVVREFDVVLAGNHDLAATEDQAPPKPGAPHDGYDWDQWTKAQLTRDDLALIRDLPEEIDEVWDGVHVHLEHRLPGPYVMPDIPTDDLRGRIAHMAGEVLFVAHAHRQMDRVVDGRRVVNPGSLGQQRDGDPRAGYAVFDRGEIELFRTGYDIARTQRAVRALPLRKAFLDCWCRFLEEGIVDMGAVPPDGEQQV